MKPEPATETGTTAGGSGAATAAGAGTAADEPVLYRSENGV